LGKALSACDLLQQVRDVTARIVAALALALATRRTVDLHAQSQHRDLPRGFRSIAGVTFNRDSAASIRTKLGNTRERRLGGGHDVFTSWCYALTGNASAGLLELMSDISDMGTAGRALNVIRLRAVVPSEEREGCATLRTPGAVSTTGGLRLGLSRSRIRELLGRPTRIAADSLIYEFDAKEYMRPGSPEYRIWNTPEHRKSCFEGGRPYVSVGAMAIVIIRDERAAEIRLERYDQATC
jgi:hypothetical protein